MLEPPVKELAQSRNFAVFTTLLSDGQPMSHVMWIDCDDEHLLINTEVHRAKFRNVERDPRVTVTIIDRENGYRFAEVRGEVVETIRGPRARAHIDELAQKYHGRPYGDENVQTERVLLKIAPRRQLSRG